MGSAPIKTFIVCRARKRSQYDEVDTRPGPFQVCTFVFGAILGLFGLILIFWADLDHAQHDEAARVEAAIEVWKNEYRASWSQTKVRSSHYITRTESLH